MSTKRISSVLAIAMILMAAALPAQMPEMPQTPQMPQMPQTPEASQAPAQTQTSSANPELVDALAREIGGTPEQAEGAAGALFGLAKSRLKTEEWAQVAGAVPGMDSLLKAVPAAGSTSGLGGALANAVAGSGELGGLASVAGTFQKLGLKPEMVAKAVPILTNYVSKMGGADVGKLLAGALQ